MYELRETNICTAAHTDAHIKGKGDYKMEFIKRGKVSIDTIILASDP
jgi:hypothetical protein